MTTAAAEKQSPFVPDGVRSVLGGTQKEYKFQNGYGASVVSHQFSYGGKQGLWELTVLDRHEQLTYTTPITDDVIGWLTAEAVDKLLLAIADLPEAPE